MKIGVANLIVRETYEPSTSSLDEISLADIGARQMSTMVYVAEIGTFKLPEMNVSTTYIPRSPANASRFKAQQ